MSYSYLGATPSPQVTYVPLSGYGRQPRRQEGAMARRENLLTRYSYGQNSREISPGACQCWSGIFLVGAGSGITAASLCLIGTGTVKLATGEFIEGMTSITAGIFGAGVGAVATFYGVKTCCCGAVRSLMRS